MAKEKWLGTRNQVASLKTKAVSLSTSTVHYPLLAASPATDLYEREPRAIYGISESAGVV